jgi:hypothetical protein
MYTHPDNAAQLHHDRHRDMHADIGSHRLARQLRDLARAARPARRTPHRLRPAWLTVPRLRDPARRPAQPATGAARPTGQA